MQGAAGQPAALLLSSSVVIPGRALRQQREGKGTQVTGLELNPVTWVPFPRIDAIAPMLAGDDNGA